MATLTLLLKRFLNSYKNVEKVNWPTNKYPKSCFIVYLQNLINVVKVEATLVTPNRLEVARSLEARSPLNLALFIFIMNNAGQVCNMSFHREQARDGKAGRD